MADFDADTERTNADTERLLDKCAKEWCARESGSTSGEDNDGNNAHKWVENTGSGPTDAQKARKHRSLVKQRLKRRENKKKVAQGEEITKQSFWLVTPAQVNNVLRREVHFLRQRMEREKASKAEIETALRAVMDSPVEEVEERIREDRKARQGRGAERKCGEYNANEIEKHGDDPYDWYG